MVLLLISVIILFIIAWLLFAPISLYINSYEDKYYIGQAGTIRLQAYDISSRPRFRLFLFGLPLRYIKFGKRSSKQKKKKQRQYKVSSTSFFKVSGNIQAIIRILRKFIRSFKIKRFYLNIDSGDVIGNAWLFPLSEIMMHRNLRMNVNYEGELELILKIRNRLSNFLLLGLRFYLLNRKLK